MISVHWRSIKRIVAFTTAFQIGVGSALAQEYIVVDIDGDGDPDMTTEVPGQDRIRYNFSDLVQGEQWVGRITSPPPRLDFILESSLPPRFQETQSQQWDAGYSQVQSDIKKMVQPIEVPPVETTPFDPAQYGLELRQQQAKINELISDALRLQAYIYQKNELTNKIREINNWIDQSVDSTFNQKNLLNQVALDGVSDNLHELAQEAAAGKLPKTPLLLPKLSPLTQSEILDIARKQVEKHYLPVYTAVTKDAQFFGIDVDSAQTMRDRIGKRALDTADADRVAYQRVLNQFKQGADRAIKSLSGINDSINAQWKELPKRRASNHSDTLALEQYEFTSTANIRDPKNSLAALSEELATVHSELVQANPRTATEENARRFGLNAAIAGDQALASGDEASASAYRDVAIAMLDVALGFTPGVGWAKDMYEAVSGQSLVTGQSLSSFERGVAVFGALTVGLGSKFGSLSKAGEAIANIAKASKISAPVIEGVTRTAATAVRIGVKTKSDFKEVIEFTARTLGNQHGSIKLGIDRTLETAERFGLNGTTEVKEFILNLASPKRTTHILHGDATGGGHLFPGKPGKSVFPRDWDAEKIMQEIADVVTDPTVKWEPNRLIRGFERFEAIGTRGNVEMKVIIEPKGEGIISAFPLSGLGVIQNP